MERFILRYVGKGDKPLADCQRINQTFGISVVEETSPKMFLVESTEEILEEAILNLPNWKFAAETTLSIFDPRARASALPLTEKASVSQLLQQVEPLGIDFQFLLDRILPDQLSSRLRAMLGNPHNTLDTNFLDDYSSILKRVFGLDVLRGQLQPAPVGVPVRFKAPTNLKIEYFETYLKYVDCLADIISSSNTSIDSKVLKRTAPEFRSDLLSNYGEITLEAGVNYLWDLSVPVLPLGHSSFFHGACWKVQKQIVVVLKQPSQHQSRWLFDIFHELYHAKEESPHDEVTIDLDTALYSPEEQIANDFAAEILLGTRAKQMVFQCISNSGGEVTRLKKAVSDFSREENIPVGVLANLVAYEVGKNGVNWWGTANNLQPYAKDPLEVVRSVFIKRFDFLKLEDSIDRSILLKAITNKRAE